MISDEDLMAYIDGAATSRDTQIQAALASDGQLRDRLMRLEAVDDGVRQAFAVMLEQPVPDHLAAMVRAAAHRAAQAPAIEAPTRRRVEYGGWIRGAMARLRDGWRANPAWVGAALASQVGLLLVFGLVLQPTLPTAPSPPAYHALGAAPVAPVANLLVIFQPDIRERDLRATLRGINARIVGGPTSADAYLLQVPAAERAGALTRLRARRDIALAEPIDSGRPQ